MPKRKYACWSVTARRRTKRNNVNIAHIRIKEASNEWHEPFTIVCISVYIAFFIYTMKMFWHKNASSIEITHHAQLNTYLATMRPPPPTHTIESIKISMGRKEIPPIRTHTRTQQKNILHENVSIPRPSLHTHEHTLILCEIRFILYSTHTQRKNKMC